MHRLCLIVGVAVLCAACGDDDPAPLKPSGTETSGAEATPCVAKR